ncbi:MAG TPA: glycoside hydrolase family 32 protein [Bacillota bacterium]|nr:glycoside hydrolase family 32 protein [Bacillota bacterium]
MTEQRRMKYHFEPQSGWMNDPNGLVYFRGQYHAFFQHNPYDTKWGPMHWGHAVSDDLLTWKELPIALTPDMPYENGGGCFSGSAVVKDDLLYLFYTSVSKEFGQTQSLATSADGIHFQKYEQNPIIRSFPPDGSKEFRDPKVTLINGIYYMVVGSGSSGIGKVLLYMSNDLIHFTYMGVLFEGSEYGEMIECPDFFRLGNDYCLMFSMMNHTMFSTMFIVGDFDGNTFQPRFRSTPEAGPQFYAPQSFEAPDGRRIVIGWFFDWKQKAPDYATHIGAFSLPRSLTISRHEVRLAPIQEAEHLLLHHHPCIDESRNGLRIRIPAIWANTSSLSDCDTCISSDELDKKYGELVTLPVNFYDGQVDRIDILIDECSAEIFINGGQTNYSYNVITFHDKSLIQECIQPLTDHLG